jgi:hypothetical protein
MIYHLICEDNASHMCDIHLETPFVKTQREEIVFVCTTNTFQKMGVFAKAGVLAT